MKRKVLIEKNGRPERARTFDLHLPGMIWGAFVASEDQMYTSPLMVPAANS
jgi:hypothetical protein